MKLKAVNILTDWTRANPDGVAVLLRYFNLVGDHPSAGLREDLSSGPYSLMPYIA